MSRFVLRTVEHCLPSARSRTEGLLWALFLSWSLRAQRAALLYRSGLFGGARRVLLLSSQEVFSDEGQAALPLENPEAMGRFPPAVTSVLGWRRARGLATGGSFPLFLEKCG